MIAEFDKLFALEDGEEGLVAFVEDVVGEEVVGNDVGVTVGASERAVGKAVGFVEVRVKL